MAQYMDITLVDGMEVRVYRPPNRRIIAMVEKKYPRPQVPTVTEVTKSGTEITMELNDDPQYLKDLEEWEETVNEEVDQFGSLFMFKDVVVPEDWDPEAEFGEEVRWYSDPEWEPREGKIGRKLDYIQWVILGDVTNANRVINAIAEMSGIDLEEVASEEASFRGEVEGETP